MTVSIIIVTYRRPKDLDEALLSVMRQSFLPKEIIVVDNSDGCDATAEICSHFATEFDKIGVLLMRIPSRENSLTVGRNLGINHSSGEIIFFLDDDATLDHICLEEILKCYSEHHDALGVQGHIVNLYKTESRFVDKMSSFLSYAAKNVISKAFPLGQDAFPYSARETIRCGRLSGISSYRRSVFKELRFDEKMKAWAFLEDADFSYRLCKLHPGTLYLTPRAKVFHKMSESSRLPKKAKIFTMTVNRLYFFFKNADISLSNILVLCLTIMGTFIADGLRLIKKRECWGLIYLITSHIYASRHLKNIRRLDLEFLRIAEIG